MNSADDIDPQVMLDWLVIQHTCEWCGGTIVQYVVDGAYPVTPKRKWMCRIVKKNGFRSKHWKNWLVCANCSVCTDFAKWVFPAISSILTLPEHEALSALVDVQPLNAPSGQVLYMDYIHDPEPTDNPCGEVALPPRPEPRSITYNLWKLKP